jgi:hypothetical protein
VFVDFPLMTSRDLERSNLNKSAYKPTLDDIYPTISMYERSMSKKTLDMY